MTEPPDASPAGEVFQALYRRFRPQTFAELRGQEHVGLALRNAVRQGRVAHAYLFSGPRGTGKTSSARILAKALNCAAPVDGEPCGACDSCRSITAGTSFDVHELDAASSNGVDAMRELVGRASLATPGRWKVYIVDEVHMLSTAASNALLKTLEEPPAHVVFVLATTEPQKVLPTIRSRTQHYEFHLLSDDVIDGLLREVARRAGLELPSGAIDLVTRRARGSARDALSALDQVAAAGVLDDDTEALAAIVSAIAAQDTGAALAALDAAVRAGRDPEQVAVELVERLRAGFLDLVAPGRQPARPVVPAAAPLGREEAESLGLARCVRTMELLGAALVAMRDAPEPRVTLELALIRSSHPQADESPAAILERLEQLERRVAVLDAGHANGGGQAAAPAPAAQKPSPPADLADGAPAAAGASAHAPSPASQPAAQPAATAGSEPASLPASRPDQSIAATPPGARPALGSFRRGVKRASEPPLAVGAGEAATARPPGEEPAAAVTPSAERRSARDAPVDAAVPAAPAQRAPARPTSTSGTGDAEDGSAALAAPRAPAAAAATDGPSRDDLVAAWGDVILSGLSLKLKAYYAAGRFVAAEQDADGRTVAIFAVPNEHHVARAAPMRGEVERALSSHFGRPVELRLRADEEPSLPGPVAGAPRPTGGAPVRAVAPGAFAGEDAEDFDELDDGDAAGVRGELPPAGLAWAEGRLLEAFPGAEEV